MTDYFSARLTPEQLRGMSVIALAHMGDCVYEIMVRTWLCVHGRVTGRGLHRDTIAHVSAGAQAAAADRIMPLLTDEEAAVYRRGRNAKVNSVPHSADISQYHAATGLEALFGWLWLSGGRERLNELFEKIMEE